jgi:hypothetical protein
LLAAGGIFRKIPLTTKKEESVNHHVAGGSNRSSRLHPANKQRDAN